MHGYTKYYYPQLKNWASRPFKDMNREVFEIFFQLTQTQFGIFFRKELLGLLFIIFPTLTDKILGISKATIHRLKVQFHEVGCMLRTQKLLTIVNVRKNNKIL